MLKFKFHYSVNRLKSSALAKDSFWTLIGSGIGKGLSLLAGIFVARFLGSTAYGEYGTIRTTLIYIAIVSTFGFGYTATKIIAESIQNPSYSIKELIRKLLIFTLVFSSILSIVFICYADKISVLLKASYIAIMLKRYSILIVFNALVSTQIAIVSGFKRFKEVSKVNIWSGCTVFIFSIIFTLCWGLDGAMLALLFSFIIQLFMNQKIINRAISESPIRELPFQWTDILAIIKFSIPISLQESLYTIVHWIGLWLLIKYSNYSQVGLYSAGSLWQSMVIFIPSMLKNVMFSYFTTSKDNDSLRRKLVLVNFSATAVPVILIMLLSHFISNFYGSSYEGIRYVIMVCVVSSIFISVSEVYCYRLISANHPWMVFISRFIRDVLILIAVNTVYQYVSGQQALYYAIISLVSNIIYLLVIIFVERMVMKYSI